MTKTKKPITYNLIPTRSGFTLVETLVAITVLVVGVLGPLNIAARGISDGIFARNQIAAAYLAQEALEVVLNKRGVLARGCQSLPAGICDDFFRQDADLAACLVVSGVNNNYCSIHGEDGSMGACSGGNNADCDLVFNNNPSVGLYQPVGIVPAGDRSGPTFTRRLKLEEIGSDHDLLRVTVIIDWQNKNTPQSLTLVEYLFSQG